MSNIVNKLKFVDTMVTFSEIPDEITLCFNISNCPIKCKDCHSKYLWDDVGTELDEDTLNAIIQENDGITCVCFMGGDRFPEFIVTLAKHIRNNYPSLKIGWYSGQENIDKVILESISNFDYIKVGPYIEEFGPLNKQTTNQTMYKVLYDKEGEYKMLEDITYKFWKNNDKKGY